MSRTFNHAAGLSQTMTQWGEIANASGTVVSRRVGLALRAMTEPNKVDHSEFTMMATEKVEAVVESAAELAHGIFTMGMSCTFQILSQTSNAAMAAWSMGMSGNGFAAAAVQRKWASDSLSAANSLARELAEMMGDVSIAATYPVHSRATANARRLGNA